MKEPHGGLQVTTGPLKAKGATSASGQPPTLRDRLTSAYDAAVQDPKAQALAELEQIAQAIGNQRILELVAILKGGNA